MIGVEKNVKIRSNNERRFYEKVEKENSLKELENEETYNL